MDPDLEANALDTQSGGDQQSRTRSQKVRDYLKLQSEKFHKQQPCVWGAKETEQFPNGYPLYASYLGRHNESKNFRRFRTLRMRMLLLKQDAIAQLEEELNEIDRTEKAELFLGCSRRDQNPCRKAVLASLDQAFSNYDNFLQRSYWVINTPDSTPKHVQSTENWLEKTGCIARQELEYFRAEPYDLLNIGQVTEQDLPEVAPLIEKVALFFCTMIRKSRSKESDRMVDSIVLSKPLIRGIARVLTAILAITLLLVPMVVLNSVENTLARFIVVFAAAVIFVTVITLASKASIAEIFAAGAAYAAVLVVFVSGNGLQAQAQN